MMTNPDNNCDAERNDSVNNNSCDNDGAVVTGGSNSNQTLLDKFIASDHQSMVHETNEGRNLLDILDNQNNINTNEIIEDSLIPGIKSTQDYDFQERQPLLPPVDLPEFCPPEVDSESVQLNFPVTVEPKAKLQQTKALPKTESADDRVSVTPGEKLRRDAKSVRFFRRESVDLFPSSEEGSRTHSPVRKPLCSILVKKSERKTSLGSDGSPAQRSHAFRPHQGGRWSIGGVEVDSITTEFNEECIDPSQLVMYGLDDPDRMTFTQSLAFPQPEVSPLTRRRRKRMDGHVEAQRRLNNYAKVITIVVLVLVSSFIVGFLYKIFR